VGLPLKKGTLDKGDAAPAGAAAAPVPRPRLSPHRQAAVRQLNVMLDAVTGPAPTLVAAWVAALILLSTQSPMLAMLSTLGFGGAFVAGLVGVGGAVVMVPLLLYVPPLFSFPRLDMHVVSGISMVQVAAAGITGMLAHHHLGHVNGSLVATVGGALVLGSLSGGLVSSRMPPYVLGMLFASLAAVAAALMLGGKQQARDDRRQKPVSFNRSAAMGMGAAAGLLVGMVGAGGGFLLVPLMMYGLDVPVRSAVGSSLAIVALGGLGGMAGKAATGQIVWVYALALVVGALPGARLGAITSRRLSTVTLGRTLGVLLAIVAVRMWWDFLVTLF
jgi:uncharacterized membrane protein YfcA